MYCVGFVFVFWGKRAFQGYVKLVATIGLLSWFVS